MRRLALPLALASVGLLLAAPAAGQPWRYEKDGAVHYTSNPDDLPPEMRARILAARAAAARQAEKAAEQAAEREAGSPTVEAADPGEARPAPRPPARPGRIRGLPPGSPEPAGPPTPRRPPTPPAPPAAEPPAERRARLTAELAAARAELTAARRAAIVMPDGRTYARRTAAEARVKALEAELAAD